MTTGKQVDSLAHYKQYCFFNKTRKHCCIIGKTSTLEGASSKILQFGIARKGLVRPAGSPDPFAAGEDRTSCG
jgi:hypothetical protein